MTVATNKTTLLARRALDKTDVEGAFGELVRVLGGTYYANGVAQGPANGLLDYRNFATNAGIQNVNRSAPYSLFCIGHPAILVNASTSVTYIFPLPIANTEINDITSLIAIGMSGGATSNSGGIGNNVSMTAQYIRNGAATTISTLTDPGASANATTLYFDQVGLSVPLYPSDLITLNMSCTTLLGGHWMHLWVKAYHSK